MYPCHMIQLFLWLMGIPRTVHKVQNVATGKYYARRRFRRRRHDSEKDKQIQKDFEKEVEILRNLDHTHLIKIKSSYTDPEYVAMLLEPVAIMSLKDYLSSRGVSPELFETERKQFRCFYGCLANALNYLHEMKVKHKDIKPGNILIGQRLEIYITDFGSATEIADDISMTMSTARARTLRYQSPELFRGAKRGRSSDIWSLGVTFLEMTTILRGETVESMQNFFSRNGTKEAHVYANVHTANRWAEHLRQNTSFSRVDNAPMQWIKDMLSEKPMDRPEALHLFQAIMHASDGSFCGKCCSSDDSTTSGTSSDSELEDDTTMKAAIPPVTERKFQTSAKPNPTSKPRKDSMTKIKKDPVQSSQHPTKSALHQRVVKNLYSTVSNLSSIRPTGTFWSSSTTNFPNVTDDEQEQDSRAKGPNAQITEYLVALESTIEEPTPENPSLLDDNVVEGSRDPYYCYMPGAFPDFEEYEIAAEIDQQSSTEAAQSPIDCQISEIDERAKVADGGLVSRQAEEPTPANPFIDTSCFGGFLFSPGPSGFITRNTALSGTYSKAFKELLLCPAPRIKRRKSDETLQLTMGTIEERMKSLLADSERHSDDSSWDVGQKRPLGEHKLDSVTPLDMNRIKDELRMMKQELDQSLPSRSLDKIHELASDTPSSKAKEISIPSRIAPPVTVHDATKAFLEDTARASEDGGLLDPTTAAQPPEDIANPVRRSRWPFLTPARPQNPLRSRLALLRAPLQPLIPELASPPQPVFLTGINLDTLNDQLPPLERPSVKPERASVYMKKVWDDAASSVATSVMSERTRMSFKMAGLFLPSQDRSADYLGQHTKTGKASAVRFLLQAGCNPETVNNPRHGPIFNTVRGKSRRHMKCLRALIEHGVDVNVWSRNDETPLLEAIDHDNWSGYVTVLYLLLGAGAKPNAKDPSGDTPLLKLLGKGTRPLEEHRREALALLLSPAHRTNVKVRPLGTRNKPIHLAIRRNDPGAVDMLLEKDASVIEAENSEGLTPLLLAATFWRISGMTPDQQRILDHLLERKAKVNAFMLVNRRTPLHIAVSYGLVEAVEKLLNHGADPDLRTLDGKIAMNLVQERIYQHGCQGLDDCGKIQAALQSRA